MALSTPIKAPDDPIKNQHYCRTITLNITFGTEALRFLTNIYLRRTGQDLKHHVHDNASCFDSRDAEWIQKKNDLNELDITKLTIILLYTLNLEKADHLHTDNLRIIRNKLCHSIIAELDNDTLFNESSQHIMRIAESVDEANGGTNYSAAMADKINELKMRKQVPAYHISFRIALCNEKFWHMMCSGKMGDALIIRYGLTKFTKTLAANLYARVFLQTLEKKEVISKKLKSDIDSIYSNEKQIEKLVFYVVNEVDDTKVLLLSQCLRQTEKCGQLLASLIEHNDGDGQTTDNLIDEKIIDILRQSLEPSPFESVISSDVHMYVEEKLGSEREYKLIWKLVQKTFGMREDMKESISGLKWKRGFDISKRLKCSCTKNQKEGKHCQDVQPPPVNVVLRNFDTPADGQRYKRGFIKPSNGNILYPSREFRHRSTENIPAAHFISKEVVLFTAACMNGRQNGTIYFGISNDKVIDGIPRCECLNNLDDSVLSAIETCFKTNASEAQLCVRPVQYLPVDNSDFVVIEVDVVPYHIYLREDILPVWFPTKGVQLKQYYIYQRKVTVIEEDDVEKQNERCSKLYAERQDLENKRKDEIKSQSKRLHDVLTEGHRYVTDAFYPIIVSGKISGSPNEITVRRQLDIEYALTSAVMILDFDNSSRLREHVEEANTSFHAMTTKDLIKVGSIGEFESSSIPWIYCNGHDKSKDQEERVQLPFKNWRTERKSKIEKALYDIRDKYQENCKVIFLVYQEHTNDTPDPMFKTALKITELFPRECLVIAENDMLINRWRQTFQEEIDSNDLPVCITELDWDSVSDVMKTSFRLNPDIECELPCRLSTYPVFMTKKEKSYFTDIDILRGKECLHETELMNDVSVADKDVRTQEDFYRGKNISWWNFYFLNHVGERDLLGEICKDVNKWLSTGRNPVKEVYIHHHPGSGGTTLGKHILWRYSQFSKYPEKINKLYRCCTLRKFTYDTIDQLLRFREYKDQGDPKPIIILIDIDDTTVVRDLCYKLRQAAERNTRPGRLFCLVIIIQRESFESTKPPLLSHMLTSKEKGWFDKRFEELENEYDSKYIDTLIAFNFLKNSFDEEHVNTVTEKLLKEVRAENIEVLKCLAVISAFEKRRNRVPKRAFGEIFNDKSKTKSWDLCMNTAMTLMLVQHDNCVSLISRSLANAIVSRFEISWKIDLPELVECLFQVLHKNKSLRRNDYVTKQLTDIVAGLFKREHHKNTVYNVSNEVKDKKGFSDLVQRLARKKRFESSTDANKRVTNILLKCFELTSDTMVAQQLVRYYIFIGEFAEAEGLLERIMRSLDWKTSYLLDTYGNLHKTHLVTLVKEANNEEKMISDKKAAEIIKMAFKAIDKFREGQANAVKENPRNGKRNTSCFFNEIKTVLYLLESFKYFKAYQDEINLLAFLNEPTLELDSSSFAGLLNECPRVRQLRKGAEFQAELEEHIRFLRDSSYQTEFDVVTVQDERLILNLHERMDRFYSDFTNVDKCVFTCPIDLKSLMEALDDPKQEQKVTRRVETAQMCIEKGNKYTYDDRDFVIYLGHTILKYSTSQEECSSEEYEQLLDYSKRLIKRQCDIEDAMLFLETFLFFGILHWPTEKRAHDDYDQFCSPKEYKMYIETWEKQFNKNLKLSTPEQKERNTPKLLFALGKGSPGNDIVNLNIIEKTVDRENQHNKEKKIVSRTDDKFWDEDVVVQRIERLSGTVDEEGSVIRYEAVYSQRRRKLLDIKLRRTDPSLQNKKVTFCVVFSWKGPVALGVKAEEPIEKLTRDKQLESQHRNVPDRRHNKSARQPLNNPTFFGSNSPEHTSSSSNTDLYGPRYPSKSSDPISVRDAEESSMYIEEIIRSQPEYVVVCCVGHLDLVVLHVNEDTYLYHLQENKALLKEGHLHHLLVNKDINRVFHDIGSVSPDLIRNYGVVMDGNVWDIQIMSELVKLEKKERDKLIPYGYTDEIFQTWSKQNGSFSKQLANIGLNRNIVMELSERGKLIGKMYTICKGKLKEKVKETAIQVQLKKEIFTRAQPIELKSEIEQLRKEQKDTKMAYQHGTTEGSRRFAPERQGHVKTKSESDGRMSERQGNNFNEARPKTSKIFNTTPNESSGSVVSGQLSYSQVTARTAARCSDSSFTPPDCVTAPQSSLEKATSKGKSTRQEHVKTESESDGRISERLGNNFNGARPKTSKIFNTTPNESSGSVVSGQLSYSQVTARTAARCSDSSFTPPDCVTAPQSSLEKATSKGKSTRQEHVKTESESDGRISERLGNNFNGARPKTSKIFNTTPNESSGSVVSGQLSYSQVTARTAARCSDSSFTLPDCVTAPQSSLEKATSKGNSTVQGNSQQRRQTKNKKKKGRKGK